MMMKTVATGKEKSISNNHDWKPPVLYVSATDLGKNSRFLRYELKPVQELTLCVSLSAVLPGTVGERPRQWSHHGRSDRNQKHADEEPDFAAFGWENLQTVTRYEKKIFTPR